MSAVIAKFLVTNFTSGLEDVNKNHHQMPLRKLFEQTELLLSKRMTPSMPSSAWYSLMDSLYKLNDVFTEWRLLFEKKKQRGLPYYTVKEVYKLCKIKRDLSSIKQKLQTEDEAASTSLQTVESLDQEHISELTEIPRIYGLDIDIVKKEIITSLMRQEGDSDRIQTVGIVGMGGSGKTTLAQLVFSDDRVKKAFIPQIWVPVSSKSDIESESTKNIVEYLLKELGDQDDNDDDDDDDDDGQQKQDPEPVIEEAQVLNSESTEESIILQKLLVRLHKQLYGKKYLIVFDDVWHINRWYSDLVNSKGEVHIGLPKEYGGGVIVTSRLEQDVGKMVGKPDLYLPPVLHDDDCWSIFKDVLDKKGINVDDHLQFLAEMQSEIVQNSCGLPLAAKTLGEIISQDLQEKELNYN